MQDPKEALKAIFSTLYNESSDRLDPHIKNIVTLNELAIQETFFVIQQALNEAFPIKGAEFSHKIIVEEKK